MKIELTDGILKITSNGLGSMEDFDFEERELVFNIFMFDKDKQREILKFLNFVNRGEIRKSEDEKHNNINQFIDNVSFIPDVK